MVSPTMRSNGVRTKLIYLRVKLVSMTVIDLILCRLWYAASSIVWFSTFLSFVIEHSYILIEAIITGRYLTFVNPLRHRSLVICNSYLQRALRLNLLPSSWQFCALKILNGSFIISQRRRFVQNCGFRSTTRHPVELYRSSEQSKSYHHTLRGHYRDHDPFRILEDVYEAVYNQLHRLG